MACGYAGASLPIQDDPRPPAGGPGIAPLRAHHAAMDEAPRWHVLITTADGRRLFWHRAGARHTLAAALGPLWVANFKPALFQVTAEGAIIPRGSQADALEIAAVELAAAEPPPPPPTGG
jgi:hypothetical protein